MNKLLSVSSLDVKFNLRDSVFHAVKNASFEISENEIVGLVGESGSGKSVTAMSLMRLLPEPKAEFGPCLLYTSPSPRDKRQSRMPSSA